MKNSNFKRVFFTLILFAAFLVNKAEAQGCRVNTHTDVHIYSDTLWGYKGGIVYDSACVQGDLIIHNGAILRLGNFRLRMAPDAKIYVQNGGKLIIKNSTVKGGTTFPDSTKNTNWGGIRVYGDTSQDQTDSNLFPRIGIDTDFVNVYAGMIFIIQSDISGADTGIKLIDGGLVLSLFTPGTWAYSSFIGGSVVGVCFTPYHHKNYSRFYNTNFGAIAIRLLTNKNGNREWFAQAAHVILNEVGTVYFYDCHFGDDRNFPKTSESKGIGIDALNSSFQLYKMYCHAIVPYDAPRTRWDCPDCSGTGCGFKNLFCGVRNIITDSVFAKENRFVSFGTGFSDNNTDIFDSGSYKTYIKKNRSFIYPNYYLSCFNSKLTIANTSDPHTSFVFQNAEGFDVSANDFIFEADPLNTYNAGYYHCNAFAPMSLTAVSVINSGSRYPCRVFKSDIRYNCRFRDDTTFVYDVYYTGLKISGDNSMLSFNCNKFNFLGADGLANTSPHYFLYDIWLEEKNIGGSYTLTLADQGNTSVSNNNTFTNLHTAFNNSNATKANLLIKATHITSTPIFTYYNAGEGPDTVKESYSGQLLKISANTYKNCDAFTDNLCVHWKDYYEDTLVYDSTYYRNNEDDNRYGRYSSPPVQGGNGATVYAREYKEPLRIYPNPTQGSVMIEFGKAAAYYIRVEDIMGRVILSHKTGITRSEIINLDNFAEGMYLVSIYKEGKIIKKERICKIKN